jgi:aminoglycoside phosphotransferase (APT) family kinase protein
MTPEGSESLDSRDTGRSPRVHAARVNPGMHPDELEISEPIVRGLVDEQFPQWRDLPLRAVSWGTVNAVYRLGPELCVRVPRRAEWSAALEQEVRWLPVLAPSLPVPIPQPVAIGVPSGGYPVAWAVYTWLDGTPMLEAHRVDQSAIAEELAGFVEAIQRIDVPSDPPSSNRRLPLSALDAPVRASISGLAADGIDLAAVTAAWEQALVVASWSGSPVWMHGDLMPTNLLVRGDGGLAGVLDFGVCTVGDPACESLLAWMTLSSSSRARYRELVALDDAAWARARGWALSFAVLAAPYYRDTFPAFAGVARRAIAEVLAENLE